MGGNYLTTTRAPGRRGTAGAERVEEEELSVATRTLAARGRLSPRAAAAESFISRGILR